MPQSRLPTINVFPDTKHGKLTALSVTGLTMTDMLAVSITSLLQNFYGVAKIILKLAFGAAGHICNRMDHLREMPLCPSALGGESQVFGFGGSA